MPHRHGVFLTHSRQDRSTPAHLKPLKPAYTQRKGVLKALHAKTLRRSTAPCHSAYCPLLLYFAAVEYAEHVGRVDGQQYGTLLVKVGGSNALNTEDMPCHATPGCVSCVVLSAP